MARLPDGVTNTMIPGTYMVQDGRGGFWHVRRLPVPGTWGGTCARWRARPAPNGPLHAAHVDGQTLTKVVEILKARIHTPPIEPY